MTENVIFRASNSTSYLFIVLVSQHLGFNNFGRFGNIFSENGFQFGVINIEGKISDTKPGGGNKHVREGILERFTDH